MAASPCAAQVAGGVGLDSDDRLRGYSLTDGHPALTGQLSYDDARGFYLSLSGLTELGADTKFLGVIGNGGYAARLTPHVTLDAGVLRSQVRAAGPHALGFEYTEIYAGAYVGPVAGRIYYSPDYWTGGGSTIYAEFEGGFEPRPNWRLSGHLGWLTYLNSMASYRYRRSRGDWRLSIERRLGKFELHAAVSHGGGKIENGYGPGQSTVVTLGSSLTF